MSTSSQTVTAITSAAIIAGIVYGRYKRKNLAYTFGIAVLFGAIGYLGSTILEEQVK